MESIIMGFFLVLLSVFVFAGIFLNTSFFGKKEVIVMNNPAVPAVNEEILHSTQDDRETFQNDEDNISQEDLYRKPEIQKDELVRVFNPDGDFFDFGRVKSRGKRRARVIMLDGFETRRSVSNLQLLF